MGANARGGKIDLNIVQADGNIQGFDGEKDNTKINILEVIQEGGNLHITSKKEGMNFRIRESN